MRNVRVMESTNPKTGEVYIEKRFDAKLVSINRTWIGETPNGKKFHIGNFESPQGNIGCRIPVDVDVSRNDEVTIAARKLDSITAFTVIGIATNGQTASADFFDTIGGEDVTSEEMTPVVESTEVVEEI